MVEVILIEPMVDTGEASSTTVHDYAQLCPAPTAVPLPANTDGNILATFYDDAALATTAGVN